MHSTSNTPVFMVACLLGVCVVLMGAHGAPHWVAQSKHAGKKPHAYLLLNHSIPETPHIRSYSNSSLSPWAYNISHEDDRFPADIFDAYCLHTGCLTVKGEETQDLLSVPIKRQILVLRRKADRKGENYFMLDYMTITVGCTCVHPHVQQH
ncbi:interleukin 17a/f1 [Alosa pseudoharengus]|uniref:interleukin 17a/f1 n=1 Tax=Alosa pseudoharengus TaxID=34774 RepID=UPI003F891FAB